MIEKDYNHLTHEFDNLRNACITHMNPIDAKVATEAVDKCCDALSRYYGFTRMLPPVHFNGMQADTAVPDNNAIANNANLFRNIVGNLITRPGIDELMTFVYEGSDFYGAPCSTIYHLCVRGGLVLHSLTVFAIFDTLCSLYKPDFPAESRAICALFHDLCKVNSYKPARKSRKTGQLNTYGKPIWEDYDAFEFDEALPYGHGEKSVYLLMKYIDLTEEEAIAIRWHMGAYDNAAKSDARTLGKATEKYPVITLLHAADLIATSMGF